MKIVKPEAHIIQKKGLTPYQFIEKVGRTCYKSEDKITEDSAVKFVKGLCNRKHFAMLEHFWVHVIVNTDITLPYFFDEMGLSNYRRYMYFTVVGDDTYVSMPIRVILETKDIMDAQDNPYHTPIKDMYQSVFNEFPDLFNSSKDSSGCATYLEEDQFCDTLVKVLQQEEASVEAINRELMKHKTHTVHFVCDRGVSHELVRHRPCSFAQESTRYCNYSHDKFDDEITVIEPCFFSDRKERYTVWKNICEDCEKVYMNLLNNGATPQEARSVLPNSLKTEIIVTANETEWQHIINLRYLGTTGAPHPQMKEVMSLVVGDLNVESEGRLRYEAN